MSTHFTIQIKRRAFALLCQSVGYIERGYPVPLSSPDLTIVDNLPDNPLELFFLNAAGLASFTIDDRNAYIHASLDGITLATQLQCIEFLNM